MAVVAAFELDDEVAAGEPARHADGGHRGLGAGVHQTHHFDRRDSLADRFRQLDLALGGRAEAGAGCERFLTACTIAGCAWPSSSGPQEPT